MFEFKLTRDPGYTVLRLDGQVHNDEDIDVLTEAFAFVQPDDHLILDLSTITNLDMKCAMLIHDVLMRRAVIAETVVVSAREEVSMQLVLHDVDRVSPIVPSMNDAIEILEGRWARRRLQH